MITFPGKNGAYFAYITIDRDKIQPWNLVNIYNDFNQREANEVGNHSNHYCHDNNRYYPSNSCVKAEMTVKNWETINGLLLMMTAIEKFDQPKQLRMPEVNESVKWGYSTPQKNRCKI